MQTDFRALAELCEKLETTSKRTLMVDLVAEFLRRLRVDEVEPATSMILSRALPKIDQRKLEVNWTTLSGVIKRITNTNWKDFTEAFNKTGDIGAAAKIVFEASRIQRQATLFEKPLTIIGARHYLKAIAETTGYGSRERKERLLETLLGGTTPLEAKYIVKVMIGEMRTGFQEGLMELAVSKAFSVPHQIVQRAGMLTGDICQVAAIAKAQGKEGVSKIQLQVFRPIKPMLAQTTEDVKEALKEHDGETALEYKLDGARVQIHKSGSEVRIYSRSLTDVTESLPEVLRLSHREIKARKAILEGEVIAVGEDGSPLLFQYLMRRFRRVHNVEEMVNLVPVKLYLFDLIFLEGRSLINDPYVERREKLRETAGGILLTRQIITANPKEAGEFLREAIGQGHEGLVAKRLESPYTPGVRGKHWFKIKKTLKPLDLVIVAAEYGYGRRHKWLSDYHLAARDPKTGDFLQVGKTFKGLTDDEIIQMTQRLEGLAIKKGHRIVIVIPKIVVEVAYNEIQKSSKYRSGLALRFARITRVRDDKGPEEIDTIKEVKEIYEKQFEKKSLYRRLEYQSFRKKNQNLNLMKKTKTHF